MPTAPPPGVSRLRTGWRSWPLPTALPAWLPTTCLLCGQWQARPLCQACVQRWRRPVVRCVRCAIALQGLASDGVCPACEDHSPEFDRAIAALDYAAPWRHVLAQFKFQERTALARPLARLMLDALAQRPHRVDLIVPVPLSRPRLLERGYNQTWLLAQRLAGHLDTPARHDLLQRARHTERLMSLDAEARRAQIAGAFEVPDAALAQIRGRHVAVVDDVLTTGATLNEVAHTLREAGARSVSAWVLARTPAPDRMRDQAD
jgi:ComF family protein